jgi:capsular polysaccharide biosynthesis protein
MSVHRRWWIVPIVAVIAAAAAYAWIQANPRDYSATAELLVTPIAGGEDTFLGVPALRQSGDTARTVQTAAGLVDSVAAARRTAIELGVGWNEARVRGAVRVQALGASTLIGVTARTAQRADAQKVANGFADSALAVRRAELAVPLRAAVLQTLSQIHRARGRNTAYVNQLRVRLDNLRVAQQSGDPSISLSQRAEVTSRAGVPAWMLLTAALLAGGAVGVAALLALDALAPAGARVSQSNRFAA